MEESLGHSISSVYFFMTIEKMERKYFTLEKRKISQSSQLSIEIHTEKHLRITKDFFLEDHSSIWNKNISHWELWEGDQFFGECILEKPSKKIFQLFFFFRMRKFHVSKILRRKGFSRIRNVGRCKIRAGLREIRNFKDRKSAQILKYFSSIFFKNKEVFPRVWELRMISSSIERFLFETKNFFWNFFFSEDFFR